MLDRYVFKDHKRLRCGYTTGSCAAAAAKAAALALLGGEKVDRVSIATPKGIILQLEVEEVESDGEWICYAVEKDSGDDSDVTDATKICALVRRSKGNAGEAAVTVDGGYGIGRVTRSGLDQPVGAAAINTVPRQMIAAAVSEACGEYDYSGTMEVIISAPSGRELAEKTFNPKLGIEGGISILGTSGIVEPMSESAIIETIRTEIRMAAAEGREYVMAAPGNYGEGYIRQELHGDPSLCIKCSNFIGETIDAACEIGLKGILLVGHIGKLVKLGAGIMNTHSKYGDCRMEVLVCCAMSAGADLRLLKAVADCVTTDEALEVLEQGGVCGRTMAVLMERIQYHISRRAGENLGIAAVVFSNKYGILGRTEGSDHLLERLG